MPTFFILVPDRTGCLCKASTVNVFRYDFPSGSWRRLVEGK
ncbi:hypothetical protein HMPREF3038_02296 [Akkermansia sp. KLE1797]|nr:hypothetical protein HMPREF3038_02296 [Akkermansia sp. KLE1797]KXU53642.1 hypothetical protein HMPREF3039_02174 [Akkermansia sp. KLE1798]